MNALQAQHFANQHKLVIREVIPPPAGSRGSYGWQEGRG
jgi:hypothetical protein